MNPRILLVEDDVTTAAFLTAAVEALPATVDLAATLAAARDVVSQYEHDLWLFDASLPDGTGIALLESLRAQGLQTPALAHTAAHEREVQDVLLAAGFDAVLIKPLSTTQLQQTVRSALHADHSDTQPSELADNATSCNGLPIWNDALAAAALKGSTANVEALRKLCLGELRQAHDDVAAAVAKEDRDGLQEVLHKLRASCGFVGASRLEGAVRALQDDPDSQQALERFYQAIQDTLSG